MNDPCQKVGGWGRDWSLFLRIVKCNFTNCEVETCFLFAWSCTWRACCIKKWKLFAHGKCLDFAPAHGNTSLFLFVSFERKHVECIEVPLVLSNFGNICGNMGEYPLKTHMEFQVKNLWQYLREETLGTCFPHYIYILISVLKKKKRKIWASPTPFYSFSCGFWPNTHCVHPMKRK